MTHVLRWSGREARALREAKRMSIRTFAEHIGVSHRMISKWEAGGERIRPRPANQEALDTAFATSSARAKERFLASLRQTSLQQQTSDLILPARRSREPVRHPVDGKLMTLVDEGVFLSGPDSRPIWVAAYYIDIYPTTNAEYCRFTSETDHRTDRKSVV